MCGIAGLLDSRLIGHAAELERVALTMARAVAHRGPDGEGVWVDELAGLALSHRRLAIVDLTETGAQPMASQDGRWIISYNGEVYNAVRLATSAALKDVVWRGSSDTEVIVESVARRGVDATLTDLNGMYAIALWDRRDRVLHLVRDRIGVKPLFVARQGSGVWFGSELKSLLAAGVEPEVDGSSVASFLRFGYVPTPFSIFRNVTKLRPGEIMSVQPDGQAVTRSYWNAADAASSALANPFRGSDREAEDELHALLSDAVSSQMMSDVPLGAFLSGGIDSSTVAALMVAADRGPVRTFSIGFADDAYNEAAHAKAVAAHLGTVHEELTVTSADALAVVPDLADMYDEPFADSSQIPTHLISKMTRAHVTVALSGDGGDELFAGYNRYGLAAGLQAFVLGLPRDLRRVASAAIRATPPGAIDRLATLIPASRRPAQPTDKLAKLAQILPLDREDIYLRLVSQYAEPQGLTLGLREHPVGLSWGQGANRDLFLERMQVFDAGTYLPDDILQKVDRASMAVSLEVRPPLLDHRVVEFAWRLPRRLRIRDGQSKWLLRRVLDRHVPPALVNRPKMGFAIPLADWLRGPLRPWAEELLDPRHLGGGLLDPGAIRRLWDEHLSGRRNWASALWTVLMFEAWRRRWTPKSAH